MPRLIEVILAGCGGSAPTKTLCCFFPIIYHPFVLGPCVERLMMSFFRKAVSRKCISPSIAQWIFLCRCPTVSAMIVQKTILKSTVLFLWSKVSLVIMMVSLTPCSLHSHSTSSIRGKQQHLLLQLCCVYS